MRNRMNKKAVSTVVASVIIIGVSIAAIAVLFPIIQNAVRAPMLSPTVACNEMRTLIPLKIIDACYTPDNEIKLKISRTMDNIGLSSIDFSLENNGKTRRWLCSDNCRNCQILQVGETKFYYLSVNEPINNAAVTLSAGECVIERKEITNPCPD